MAVSNIKLINKGQYACHTAGVTPAITVADWDQSVKKYATLCKPIADAAAGTSYEWPIFSNLGSASLQITAVRVVPFAALTAHDTNYKTLNLNRRLAAATAVVAASLNTKITGGTGDWVALTPLAMTLSATAANTVVAPSEDLSLHLVFTAAGVVVPVLTVTVEYYEI